MDTWYLHYVFLLLCFIFEKLEGKRGRHHKREKHIDSIEDVTDSPTNYGPEIRCQIQPNYGPCLNTMLKNFDLRYYWDTHMQDCAPGNVDKCNQAVNSFEKKKDCREACRDYGHIVIKEVLTPIIFCQLQPTFGLCSSYHPMWYYDVSEGTCRGFSYSGCEGNQNKFDTFAECSATCSPYFKRKRFVFNKKIETTGRTLMRKRKIGRILKHL